MEASNLFFCIFVALSLFFIFDFIFKPLKRLFFRYFERRCIPNKYEWLRVLSREEWKVAITTIGNEMQTLKKWGREWTVMHVDLTKLRDEGLVERITEYHPNFLVGEVFGISRYRLTVSGERKKLELENKVAKPFETAESLPT
jgi:hypothetical protein